MENDFIKCPSHLQEPPLLIFILIGWISPYWYNELYVWIPHYWIKQPFIPETDAWWCPLFKDVAFFSCGFWSLLLLQFLLRGLLFPSLLKTSFVPALPWGWAAVFSGFHKLELLPPHSDPLPVTPPPLSFHAGSVWTSFYAKDSPRLIFRMCLFSQSPDRAPSSHTSLFSQPRACYCH